MTDDVVNTELAMMVYGKTLAGVGVADSSDETDA